MSPSIAKRVSVDFNEFNDEFNDQTGSPLNMTRKTLHKFLKDMTRQKDFTFKPTITPLSERLALSARLQQQYITPDG
jgi:hypothetical protein